MKKLTSVLLMLLAMHIGHAQTNLREGIVITLAGDTLHGQIDFRTDAMNAEKCVFWANGTTESKTYRPGEIEGYRFLDNGRYYVTREVPVDGMEQTLFLEYVVQGQLNLYYLGRGLAESIFYFENVANGSSAIVKQSNAVLDTRQRRERLADAYAMLGGSPKAQQMLATREIKLSNLAEVTTTYNDEVCPDGQCQIFKYRKKKMPQADKSVHWSVYAGYTAYGIYSHHQFNNELTFYPGWNVGACVDIYVPRLCQGLLFQTAFDYCYASGESNYKALIHSFPRKSEVDVHDFTFKMGPAYQLSRWKLQPRIGAGMIISKINASGVVRTDYYSSPEKPFETNTDIYNLSYSYYLNFGLVYPLRKGALLFKFDYTKKEEHSTEWDIKRFDCSLGYQF